MVLLQVYLRFSACFSHTGLLCQDDSSASVGKERTDSNLASSCILDELRSKKGLLGRCTYCVNVVPVCLCCRYVILLWPLSNFDHYNFYFLSTSEISVSFLVAICRMNNGVSGLPQKWQRIRQSLKGSQKSFCLRGARWSDGRIPQSFLVTNWMKCEGITGAGRSPKHLFYSLTQCWKSFIELRIALSFCFLLNRIMFLTDKWCSRSSLYHSEPPWNLFKTGILSC
jgi:hypothetical protein